MRMIADVMGADRGTAEIIQGAFRAKDEFGFELTLVGDEKAIRRNAAAAKLDLAPVRVVDAPETVAMDDDPSAVIREKKGSSMAAALRLLADGEGDALVSSGNTGALLTGATLIVKRIRGVRRAALSPAVPTSTGGSLLIDSGANVECTPEMLLQFALMGHFFSNVQFQNENPRVGLLNMGTESTKGLPLQRDAYVLLEKAHQAGLIHFVGNVEARDIPLGVAEVLVTDGFTGNMVLKTYEGVGLFLLRELKSILSSNAKGKAAALLVRGELREFKNRLDYKEVGGAPLLGISRPVIKAHGSSDARAFASALKQAVRYAQGDIIRRMEEHILKTQEMAGT